MTYAQIVITVIFIGTIVGLIIEQKRPALVLGVTILSCYGFDLISTKTLLSNAVNTGLITMLLLVSCSFAIEKTVYLRRLIQVLLNGNRNASLFRTFLLATFSSALLNNTAVVATLLGPIKHNRFISPSKLLLPISYLSIVGGTLTLVGTSTNLVVNSLMIEAKLPELHFFDFTLIGGAVVVTVFITIWFCVRFLPKEELQQQQERSYFVETQIPEHSSLIGHSIDENGLRHLESFFLVEIIRNNHALVAVKPSEILQAGDKLLFSGDINKINLLQKINGLVVFAKQTGLGTDQLTEVIIRESSAIVGKTLKSAHFRSRFDAAVVGIRREGEPLSGKLGDLVLAQGDFLILATGDDFNHRSNLTKNFHLVSGVTPEFVLTGWRQRLTLIGFILALFIAVTFGISYIKVFLFYLAGLIISNCITVNELKHRFPVEIWLIVTGALVLTSAFTNVGLDQLLANKVELLFNVKNTTPDHAHVILAFITVYMMTLLLTEVITNNASAALAFPIALSFAHGMDVNVMPFIMAVVFGASASFISPYGYQTNLMVYNAGGYRLIDYLKLGIPVSIVYSVTALVVIPMVFPF